MQTTSVLLVESTSVLGSDCTRMDGVTFTSKASVLDPGLPLDAQGAVVIRSAYYQLRLVHQLCSFVDKKGLSTVIHALVTSRLDYCNLLYVELALKAWWKLQLVQLPQCHD